MKYYSDREIENGMVLGNDDYMYREEDYDDYCGEDPEAEDRAYEMWRDDQMEENINGDKAD